VLSTGAVFCPSSLTRCRAGRAEIATRFTAGLSHLLAPPEVRPVDEALVVRWRIHTRAGLHFFEELFASAVVSVIACAPL